MSLIICVKNYECTQVVFNENQPEKGAKKKCKHPDDSNTELQQREKSKKQNDDIEKEAKKKRKKNKDRICYCRQENHKLLHNGHLSVLLQVTTTKWKKR